MPRQKQETRPLQKMQILQAEKPKTDARRPQKRTPSFTDKEKKAESKQTQVAAEVVAVEKEGATGEKTVALLEKSTETLKKKKDWILIIAIIVFGILLLVIQFSEQLGIEGFP